MRRRQTRVSPKSKSAPAAAPAEASSPARPSYRGVDYRVHPGQAILERHQHVLQCWRWAARRAGVVRR